MTKLVADNAVRTESDDALGRTDPAHLFVEQVLIVDASEGLVVAVIGPWGSGKTSFINLTRKAFADVGAPVVDFNPCMFSGADQLVD
jgi:predicted KAP-like P-loop ATPase